MLFIITIKCIFVLNILTYFFTSIGYNNNIVLLLTYISTYCATHCILLIITFSACGLLVRINQMIDLLEDLFCLKDTSKVKMVINESYYMEVLKIVSSMYSEMLKVSKLINTVFSHAVSKNLNEYCKILLIERNFKMF